MVDHGQTMGFDHGPTMVDRALRNGTTVRNHGLTMVNHGHHDHGQPFLKSMVNHGHGDHGQPWLTVVPFLKAWSTMVTVDGGAISQNHGQLWSTMLDHG